MFRSIGKTALTVAIYIYACGLLCVCARARVGSYLSMYTLCVLYKFIQESRKLAVCSWELERSINPTVSGIWRSGAAVGVPLLP